MAASTKLLPAGLSTRLLAFSRTMTLLQALMGTASECLTANISAADIREPTWLVLEYILATQTSLGSEKRTFWAAFFVTVATVGHLRVATVLRTFAWKAAWWWFRATGKRRL